jgi:hypothetical protein
LYDVDFNLCTGTEGKIGVVNGVGDDVMAVIREICVNKMFYGAVFDDSNQTEFKEV